MSALFLSNKHLFHYWKLTLRRALGGFTPPISPARTCCARGTFTSRLCPFRCTGEWRLPAFFIRITQPFQETRAFAPRALLKTAEPRETRSQRTSFNLCCCWKTNSTSGYYIKLASHVGARLHESANKRLSDSADVYLLLFFFIQCNWFSVCHWKLHHVLFRWVGVVMWCESLATNKADQG